MDKGLVPESVMPRPDVYIVAASDAGAALAPAFAASLRRAGLHARFSYKATRNVGKLMKDVNSCGARFAMIVNDDAEKGTVELKDMASGDQEMIAFDEVANRLR